MDSSHTPNDALPTWRERIRSVLAEANEPLHVSEIEKRIQQAGLATGQTPGRTISYELNELSNSALFERLGGGVYALRSEEAFSEPTTKRIVKIAPGKDAMYWGECREGGYICVGWDTLGDLSRFATKEDFLEYAEEELKQFYAQKSKRSEKATEVWTLRELCPGDIVLANQGTSKIIGVGDVVEPTYFWNPERIQPLCRREVAFN